MPIVKQDLAVEGAVADRVVGVVGQPDRVVRRHEDAMRARIDPLAPGAQEVALAVEDAHRVLAAVEGIDVVVLVDPDGGNIGVEFHPRRQFRPAVMDLVAEAVRAQHDRHGATSHSGFVQHSGAIIETAPAGSTRAGRLDPGRCKGYIRP